MPAPTGVGAEPELAGLNLGDVLLLPTRIYARDLLGIRADLEAAGHEVRGMAHITGGGLPGNVPRALPEHLGARLDPTTWPMPSVMRMLGALGGIADTELRATFNGGLGMVDRGAGGGRGGHRGPGRVPGGSRRGSWARWSKRRRSVAGTWRREAHGERTDRGRGLRDGVEPAGARGRGGAGRAGRRRRPRVRGPGLSRPGLGRGAGHRHDPGPRRRRRDPGGDPRGGRARRGRPGRVPAAGRAGGAGRRSAGGSSTCTRRCSRRSRGCTGRATPWPRASP